MHNIQRKILISLLYAESLGYAEMRPSGVESNHYAYHLDQLVRAQLISKADKKYSLAPAGLALVDRMSQEKMIDRLQPHILTVIDITNDKGETLVYKRAFQPYINTYAFPLGKTHYEESVENAAQRELEEKTGITGVALKQRGIAYLTVTQQDQIISKVICHVFQGHTKDAVALPKPNKRGACSWIKVSDMPKGAYMPGFLAIKKLLAENKTFFFTELYETISV